MKKNAKEEFTVAEGQTEAPALVVNGLVAGYGAATILKGVDMHARLGEVVLLVGHNGAGKSTLLRSVLGFAQKTDGDILLDDESLSHLSVSKRVGLGIGYVPQSLGVFPRFTVEQCLDLGGYMLHPRRLLTERKESVYQVFPALREHASSACSLLSGGEQRLLMLGMALMLRPRVLLVDEPSAGLAPARVDEVMSHLRKLPQMFHMAILLVEQNITAGLSIANRVYVLRDGRVVSELTPDEISKRESFWDLI